VNDPIEDKASKPPGLLPKHIQSWLIVGIAFLMILIMWLTGAKKPLATPRAGTLSGDPSPLGNVNEGKINELQTHIQQLQREQMVAQNALAQQSHMLAANPGVSPNIPGAEEHVEDPIEAERKKRGYLSLFASNVALSYRKSSAGPGPEAASTNLDSGTTNVPAPAPSNEAASLAQFLKTMQPPVPAIIPSAGSPTPGGSTASSESDAEKKEMVRPAAALATRNTASGNTYILFEGTILETVLVNRLDGSFSGPVECLVTTQAYSHDRQHLLVPAGSRVLGETRKVQAFGETRLAVLFHRLIMPDGYSVSLDQFKGLNQEGDTGLRDRVNNHYLRIFGASLAIGALGAVAEAGTSSVLDQSGVDRLREGFGVSSAQSAQQILEKFLNVLPTITIREGHRVKVYLSGDLPLPDYANHTMPSNL
jgi:type IV secretory pathway VirB10-like protein